MKYQLPLSLALAAGLWLGAPAPAPSNAQETEPAGTLASRVQALETQLKELQQAHKAQAVLLEQTVTYLENQAEGAAALSQSLSESDRLGFTKGINFQSREVLLQGFQSLCSELQKDVPRLQEKPADQVAQDPRVQRR